MSPSAKNSEDVVASVLMFLASEPERLARFFILTGLRADTIRQVSRAPGFAASVLDYVLADEKLLLAFASAAQMRPEELAHLRENQNRAPEPPGDRRQTSALVRPSNMGRRFGATRRSGEGEARLEHGLAPIVSLRRHGRCALTLAARRACRNSVLHARA